MPLHTTISGQGPVGLALALFARRAGVPAEAIGFELPLSDLASLPESLAQRSLALSLGSWQLLQRIITPPPAGVIREVQVSMAQRAGYTQLRADDLGAQALGYVVDYRALLRALRASLGQEPLGTVAPSQALQIQVHAEGQPADGDSQVRDFDQRATLTNLHCPTRHPNHAFERFSPRGPIALLPLATAHHFSLVWCNSSSETQRLASVGDAQFLAELQPLLGQDLSAATLLAPRVHTAVQRRQRDSIVRDTQVWIGNSAQALHPVAGQGLNLGLRDAFELAQCLGGLYRTVGEEISATRQREQCVRALEHFARHRRSDRSRTVRITDALASMFTQPWAAQAQSLALSCLDLTPALRNQLARQLMFGVR